jgi:hypothetical protein
VQKFQLDRCKMINTFTPGAVLNAENHISTNFCYVRDCTSIHGDDSSPGVDNLWGWCANTTKFPGANDLLWHVVNHTYVRRAINCVDIGQLQTRMTAAAADGWDVQYLGTVADPTLLTGAVFVTDPNISAEWPPDNTAALWPTIHSPLIGADIGSNPFAL